MRRSTHNPDRRAAAIALAILTLINLFNYLDRFIVSALAESLKRDGVAPTDFALGFLMTGFLVVYMCAAPVFGALGDTRSRPRLIAFGILCWSLATVLSGFAQTYAALLAARAAVGIGEAAYGTIAPSLIADYYPERTRGRVMAIFFCAIPIGSALGYVVGGLVDAHFGWRMAFFVAGVPGIALAASTWRLHDPARASRDSKLSDQSLFRSSLARYRKLLDNIPYVLTVLGYAAYTFAIGGLAFWMPAFLERVRHMPRAEATVSFGAIVVVTGFIGTFAGGWLGDYLWRYSRQAYLWLSSVATLVAVPLTWIALTTNSTMMYLIAMPAAQLCMFLSTGPINATIINLAHPLQRASAVALSVFAIHLLGDIVSPPMIGALSDATSLAEAVKLVPVAIAVSAALWAWAAMASRRQTDQRPPSL